MHIDNVHSRVALYAWAFTPVVNLIGLYVPYPNQIRVLYGTIVVGLLFWVTNAFDGARRELALGLLWPLSFGLAFIFVSYFGLDFKYSVRFHVLYQPLLHTIPFLTWFAVARYFEARIIFEALLLAALVMAIHSFGLVLFAPSSTRLLSDLSVPYGIAGGAIIGTLFGSSKAYVIGLAALLIALWICLKKTVLVCGILALLVPLIGYGAFHANRKRIGASLAIAALFIVPLHTIVLKSDPESVFESAISLKSGPTPDARPTEDAPLPDAADASGSRHAATAMDETMPPKTTVERFFERPDATRVALDRLAKEMLAQYFPHGIGYMSFMKESIPHINYTTYTVWGEQLTGVSLHNTYMHFALEGGWLIVVIVVAGVVVFVHALYKLFMASNHAVFLALLTWALITGLYGWYQQVYQTDYLFGLLGFALGAAASVRTTEKFRQTVSPRSRNT